MTTTNSVNWEPYFLGFILISIFVFIVILIFHLLKNKLKRRKKIPISRKMLMRLADENRQQKLILWHEILFQNPKIFQKESDAIEWMRSLALSSSGLYPVLMDTVEDSVLKAVLRLAVAKKIILIKQALG